MAGRETPFVGRERELAAASAALAEAVAGDAALLLVAGEGGIGKSRLCLELARQADGQGVAVAWGRTWEAGGAPPYWPWVQALRAALRQSDGGVRRLPRRIREVVAPVLPELEGRKRPSHVESADGETARFQLFQGVGDLIRQLARERPLAIVLDDVHLADDPSLLLLQFVAGDVRDGGLLLAATYRPHEARRRVSAQSVLADLQRLPNTRYLELGGVGQDAVETWARSAMGNDGADVAPAVHARTEGNPLFAQELIRLLAAGHRPQPRGLNDEMFPLSDVGRTILVDRLQALDAAERDLLQKASVIGREFDVDAVAHLAGLDPPTVWQRLDAGLRERLLEEAPSGGGTLRFVHVLLRDVAYEEVRPAERALLHRRLADELKRRHAAAPEPHLGAIAHHYVLGASPDSLEEALRYTRLAADHAVSVLAYEEAARLYRVALELAARGPSTDGTLRCDLLLQLADAEARGGRADDAKATYLKAADLAKRSGLTDRRARAALGYGGRFVWVVGRDDHRLRPLLEDALDGVAGTRNEWEARLLARLAAGPVRGDPPPTAAEDLSRQAVEIARQLGDAPTLAYVLDARCTALLRPDNARQRLAVASELRGAAEEARDLERIVQAHVYRVFSALELGDTTLAKGEMRLADRVARELGQPAQQWLVGSARATLSLLQGPLDEAERSIRDAHRLGQRAENWNALTTFRLQLYTLRLLQGRHDELVQIARSAIAERPQYRVLRFLLPHALAAAGDRSAARLAVTDVVGTGLADLPFDEEWLFAMNLAGETASMLEDGDLAADIAQWLAPFHDQHAVAIPEVSHGSVARVAGLLRALIGDTDAARSMLEAAVANNARAGAEPWRVLSQNALDQLDLASSNPPSDETERIAVPSAAVLRREGDVWAIQYESDAFRLRDSKGLRYLATLLAAPAREFHARDLVAMESATGRPAGTRQDMAQDAGSGIVALDAAAKRAYRQRLNDLEAELAESEDWQDDERTARLARERAMLVDELAAAVGLGGRDRVQGSDAERARVSVTKAIGSALSRIRPHSAALHAHLVATVRTGLYCSYNPDPRVPIRWDT